MTTPARARALFISDLHLQAGHPRTTDAFLRFLDERAIHADALYLLGDIFEYWAGDDDLADPYHQAIAGALRALAARGVALYWMAGNRDFLAGAGFAEAAGLRLLGEPHLLREGGHTIALVHGDAQCTGDTGYMAFRAQVRDPAWQRQFLAMPLDRRKAIIAGLREGSRSAQQDKSYAIMDVAPAAVDALFDATGADTVIHGHTHRPALHVDSATGRRRFVLPDWDCDAEPPRGGWIALAGDRTLTRHGADGQIL
jgi:UDP-2,3-diacylglucosamine hydrolase